MIQIGHVGLDKEPRGYSTDSIYREKFLRNVDGHHTHAYSHILTYVRKFLFL
jgi:hypothetical protein